MADSISLRFGSVGDRVVVPGGGSGIGRGVALALADAGATVFVLGRRREKLEETTALAASAPGRVVPLACDVLEEEQVAAAFAAIAAAGGPAAGLAHCAAAVTYVPAAELTPGEFREVVASALFGAFNVLSAWGRALLSVGRPGAAVFVTSSIAARGTPGAAHSSAGKAAVEAMMRTVAREWGPAGLRLNCFGPGFFPVERNAEWIGDPANVEPLEAKIPLGRLGELHEAVGPILFLLSDAAGYTTGETLNVDGGFRLTPEVLPKWDYENLRGEPWSS
jgi:NAD(P)-dependent dehydrogenase (short-subunit alcohol dehydrogenase family)